MMRSRWALCLALLAAAGCDKLPWGKDKADASSSTAQSAVLPNRPPVAPGDVVATVNGVPIARQDVEQRVQEFKALAGSMNREWTPLTPEQLQVVLNELVNNELMSQDAVARGLDRSTETQRRWDLVRRSFFMQEWIRNKQAQHEVGSAEVEQYYEQNKQGFRVPERRRLRQISVASEEQAKQALTRVLGESDFGETAKQVSLAPTASDGGMIAGWVMRGNEKAVVFPSQADAAAAQITSLEPALEAAAFAIDKVGGVSSYVKGQDNRYHIFQLAEREQERIRPLNEVWDQIKNGLTLQKLQGELQAVRQSAKVETFPERLTGMSQ
jgi:peptidyl-prolyl cis-trans isomerase C